MDFWSEETEKTNQLETMLNISVRDTCNPRYQSDMPILGIK